MNDDFKTYNQGWNARIRGDEYESSASREWRDGWMDCHVFIENRGEPMTLD
jgi:hypothetical protein